MRHGLVLLLAVGVAWGCGQSTPPGQQTPQDVPTAAQSPETPPVPAAGDKAASPPKTDAAEPASEGAASQQAASETASPAPAAPVEPVGLELPAPEGEDFLAEALAMNSDEHPVPKPEFREGHATPRELDPKMVTKTEDGFVIQMPSGTPVPTPTIYRGRLCVSGGFSCKEYYCFDAETGEPLWAVDLDDDGPSSCVPADDSIIFNTESCTIFDMLVDSGKLRWAWWLGDPLMSQPTVAGGRVFTTYPVAGQFAASGDPSAPFVDDPVMPFGDTLPDGANAEAPPPADDESQNAGAPAPGAQKPRPTHALICFDEKTGKTLWQRWIDTECMSAPIAHGERLYVATLSGTLYEFNQADGRILAARRLRATSPPVIAGNRMFYTRRADAEAGAVEGGEAEAGDAARPVVEAIVCRDRESGTETLLAKRTAKYLDWRVQVSAQSTLEAAEYESINAIGGGFGGGFSGGSAAPGNPAPGSGPFAVPPEDTGPPVDTVPPVAAAQEASGPPGVSAMDQPPADLLEHTQQGAAFNIGQGNVSMLQSYHGSRVLPSGDCGISCMGDLLVSVSAKSGEQLWSVSLEGDLENVGGYLGSPPVAAGGRLFLATYGGEVLDIDPKDGHIAKRYQVGSALRFPPVVEKGRIYVGTQDGKVVCIDTGNRALSGWPMWGRDPGHSGTAAPAANE